MARKKSEAEKQITKELRRIRAGILRAQKRGYFFDIDPLETLTKKAFEYKRPQTIAKKLSEVTPTDIYKVGYHTTDTGVVKGLKYREIEKAKAKEKAAKTREAKKEWEIQREAWMKGKGYETTKEVADEAETVIRNVIDDTTTELDTGIDTTGFLYYVTAKLATAPYEPHRTDSYNGWKRITRHKAIDYINDAIDMFGVKTVAKRLEQHATEIRELVDRLIYDSYAGEGDAGAKRDLTRLIQIVYGGNITDEGVKELS